MYEDDEDEFAPLGTAFAPLEADEIVSRKPEIDQTVRDERGRRRFHGAFTGGFSAGYWNTVGSAEGFTPQIFSSSRINKYDHQKSSKPEDYMDDEDFGSFGIAPKRIHTKADFTENVSFAGLRDTSLTFDDVIKSVFAPAKESIGMRLFRKMKRHIKMEQKDQHRDLFLMADHNQSSSHISKETLQYETKGDLHGLGYSSMLDPNNFLYGDSTKALAKSESVSATLAGGRKLKISGEAFGYGASEDDDDDLLGAVYSKDDMSQYDFAIGGVAPRQKPKQKRVSPYGTLSGNTLELEAFDKATKATSLFNDMRKNYRLPELPRNWRPKRRGKAEQTPKRSRWDTNADSTKPPESISVSEPKRHQQPTLNANLRAVILGEEVVHKMGIAKSKSEQPKTLKESEPTELAFDKVLHPSIVQPQVKKALSGFLASRFTHGSSALDDVSISAGLSTFKDLTSTPGFDSNQHKSSEEQEATADEKKPTRITFEWHPHKLLCKRFGLQNPYPLLTDVVGIVSINRDGQNTRNMTSTIQNVKGSNSRTLFAGLFGNLGELGSFNPALSEKSVSSFTPGQPKTDTAVRENQATTFKTPAVETTNRNQTREIVVEVSDSDDEKEPEKSDRPHIDLFKSIFASDEEDSEEDKDDERVESEPAKKLETKPSAVAENDSSGSNFNKVRSDKGGGSGIFAGVDFVQLNQNFNPCLKLKGPEETKENPQNDVQLDEDCYGPALPPLGASTSLPTHSTSNSTKNKNCASNQNSKSSATGDEPDRKMRHKNKKRNKDKKKKSKKKSSSSSKSKKSFKDRKRKRSSSEDSSSVSSGEPEQLMRRMVPCVDIEELDAQLVDMIRQAKYRRL